MKTSNEAALNDEELIKALRGWMTSTSFDDDAHAAADRIEQLVKERGDIVQAQESLVETLSKSGLARKDAEAKLAKAVDALRFLEIAATGAGVPHPQERKLLHETIRKARELLTELERTE